MKEPNTDDSAIAYAIALLSHYGFELRGYTAAELVNLWLKKYQTNWVRLGVIEALYQGRYKAISVEQILAVWARRGQPIYRFNHEFERLISRKLPQSLAIPYNAGSPEKRQKLNLPPLTKPDNDTTLDDPRIGARPPEPAPVAQQDTPPPPTMPKPELAEIPVNLDDQIPEILSDIGANPNYETDWSRCEVSKPPIHQFTPPPDSSGFYLKLKAVVQQEELGN